MLTEFQPRHLDVPAFAQAGVTLRGNDVLSNYERLLQESGGQGADRQVQWEARGAQQSDASGHARIWLHLSARLSLPLTCQRCLGPVDIVLDVARDFRFVATEAQAETEDEEAEEDVLVLSRDFDLQTLVEDELLMALPLVPRHEACPTALTLAVQDADFEAAQQAQPKPFAVLAGLKTGRKG
ncbi:MAG: YceD family protein [Hylemonella sp.]|uniref:YceD family protein n=1 Tax=Hylemonella sp. TaxID=2066020 RepID=UPI0022C46D51|nr:YceD family protein [Hylemonella sp.]MCZ8251061.1 YceD family protein [Hylemonella sp.]